MTAVLLLKPLAGLVLLGSLAASDVTGDDPQATSPAQGRPTSSVTQTVYGEQAQVEDAKTVDFTGPVTRVVEDRGQVQTVEVFGPETRVIDGGGQVRYYQGMPSVFVAHHGIHLQPVDATLRSQLGLPRGTGLVATNVGPDNALGRAGVKEHDILLTLDGKPLNQPQEVNPQLAAAGDRDLTLTLLRGGKEQTLTINAEARREPVDYWIGLPVAEADETLRSHLDLPRGVGLVVTDVLADSPATKAGLKKNDILLKMGDTALKDTQALFDAVKGSGGKATKLDLLRGGKPLTLEITPAPRPAQATTFPNLYRRPFELAQTTGGVQVVRPGLVLGQPGGTRTFAGSVYAPISTPMPPNPPTGSASSGLDAVLDQLKALTQSVDALRKAIESK